MSQPDTPIRRFEAVCDGANTGIAIAGLDGELLYINPYFAEVHGYDPAELIGVNLSVFHTDEQIAGVERINRDLVRDGSYSALEVWHKRRDGSVFPMLMNGVIIKGRRGASNVIAATAVDITELKQADDALRRSEERYRRLFEAIPVGIAVTTAQGEGLAVNKAMCRTTGYSEREFLQLDARTHYLNPEDRKALVERLRKEGAVHNYELHLKRKDGAPYFALLDAAPFELAADRAILSVMQDITDLKNAEESLTRYAARVNALHEIDTAILAAHSPEEIAQAALGHVAQLVPCSRAAVALFDLDAMQGTVIAGTGSSNAPVPGARVALNPRTLARLDTSEPLIFDGPNVQTELPECLRGGPEEPVGSFIWGPLTSEGDLVGCIGLASEQEGAFGQEHQDIIVEVSTTLAVALRQSRLSAQVETARERLEALSRRLIEVQESERRHLARELHDEVGQELTALKLFLESIGSTRQDGLQSRLDEAQQVVNRLISRIRDMSLDLRPSMLDDLGLIPTLLWLFQRCESQAGLQVSFKHVDAERRFAPQVESSAYRIIQEALTNIARHAGTDKAKVRVRPDPTTLVLQVEDSGCGFDYDAAMADRQASGIKGMRERAALLGGTFVVNSTPGAGTSIAAELPLKPASRGESE